MPRLYVCEKCNSKDFRFARIYKEDVLVCKKCNKVFYISPCNTQGLKENWNKNK